MLFTRVLTALAATSISSTAAQDMRPVDPHAKAGYFVSNLTSDGDQYVIAINAVRESGDIYWHMSVPTTYSWMGVGIGDGMSEAFMLVSYKTDNGTGVSTSPRRGTGQNEPVPIKDVEIETIWNDLYAPGSNIAKKGGIMISHAVCRGCANLTNLDYNSKAQPFIFAVGPEVELSDSSRDAPLRRHAYYGRFTMDLMLATTPPDFSEGGDYGRVPAPNIGGHSGLQSDTTFATEGSTLIIAHKDTDPHHIVHATMMCVAFMFVFPLGSLMLRLTNSTRAHWAVQCFGALMVAVGFACAMIISLEYNRGKRFNTPHQVIGFLCLAGVAIQLGLGITHHQQYKRTKKPSAFNRIHIFLGPSIILLGIINGGLGLNLAGDTFARIPYAITVLVLGIVFIIARGWLHLFRNQAPYVPDSETLEVYRRTNSFGVGSPATPKGYAEVGVPEAYHENQTPASARSNHFTWEMSTPVTVAPPTPKWPEMAPERGPRGMGRSGSGASRSTTWSEQDSIAMQKGFR